jgi:hypothetical protein
MPELDIIRVQDTEIYQADDLIVLAWAAKENRILLTHDLKTIPPHAYARIEANLPMPGVFAVSNQMPLGQAISELLLILGASDASEWENLVFYLPV